MLFNLIHHTLGRTESIGPAKLIHLYKLCLDIRPHSRLNSNRHS